MISFDFNYINFSYTVNFMLRDLRTKNYIKKYIHISLIIL